MLRETDALENLTVGEGDCIFIGEELRSSHAPSKPLQPRRVTEHVESFVLFDVGPIWMDLSSP